MSHVNSVTDIDTNSIESLGLKKEYGVCLNKSKASTDCDEKSLLEAVTHDKVYEFSDMVKRGVDFDVFYKNSRMHLFELINTKEDACEYYKAMQKVNIKKMEKIFIKNENLIPIDRADILSTFIESKSEFGFINKKVMHRMPTYLFLSPEKDRQTLAATFKDIIKVKGSTYELAAAFIETWTSGFHGYDYYIAKQLIEGINQGERDRLFFQAIATGKLSLVKLFTSNGVDVNKRYKTGGKEITAFEKSIIEYKSMKGEKYKQEKRIKIIKHLINRGADINTVSKSNKKVSEFLDGNKN